jgi:2'-5' RNA ligase
MYFIGILCPEGINERVLLFKHRMRDLYGCKVALRSPAHITLVTPFWWMEDAEDQLQDCLQQVHISSAIPTLILDGFSHFEKRVLFIHVANDPLLDRLRSAVLSTFIARFPGTVKPEDRLFYPHLTIANRDMKPNDFDEAWKYFSRKEFAAEFVVTTITLFKLIGGKWVGIGVIDPRPKATG